MRLRLAKETLTELTADELLGVVAGASDNVGCVASLLLPRCVTDLCLGTSGTR